MSQPTVGAPVGAASSNVPPRPRRAESTSAIEMLASPSTDATPNAGGTSTPHLPALAIATPSLMQRNISAQSQSQLHHAFPMTGTPGSASGGSVPGSSTPLISPPISGSGTSNSPATAPGNLTPGATLGLTRPASATSPAGGPFVAISSGGATNMGLSADLPSQVIVDDLMSRLAHATKVISQPNAKANLPGIPTGQSKGTHGTTGTGAASSSATPGPPSTTSSSASTGITLPYGFTPPTYGPTGGVMSDRASTTTMPGQFVLSSQPTKSSRSRIRAAAAGVGGAGAMMDESKNSASHVSTQPMASLAGLGTGTGKGSATPSPPYIAGVSASFHQLPPANNTTPPSNPPPHVNPLRTTDGSHDLRLNLAASPAPINQLPQENVSGALEDPGREQQRLLLPAGASSGGNVPKINFGIGAHSSSNGGHSQAAPIGFGTSRTSTDGVSELGGSSFEYDEEADTAHQKFRCGVFPTKFRSDFVPPLICVTLMIGAGLLVAILLYRSLHNAELSNFEDNLDVQCAQRAKLLQQNFGFALTAMHSMAGFFSVQQRWQENGVLWRAEEWNLYVDASATPEFVDQFVWTPVVLGPDRAAFEALTGHVISNLFVKPGVNGSAPSIIYNNPVAQAPFYLPYQYQWPNFTLPKGAPDVFNIDAMWAFPAQGVEALSINRAIGYGKLLFTNRQPLTASIHDPTSKPQWGMVAMLPVYKPYGRPQFTGNLTRDFEYNLPRAAGMVNAVLRASVALQQAIDSLSPLAIHHDLFETETGADVYITEYDGPDVDSSDLQPQHSSSVAFVYGQRRYRLDCVPTYDYVQTAYSSTPILIGVGSGIVVGVCIMILLCGWLVLNVRRSNQRAAMLIEANASKNAALTLLAQAKELADRANKSKSDFLAFLCHELRNPLHAISAMVDFLHTDYFSTSLDREIRDDGHGDSDRSTPMGDRAGGSPNPFLQDSEAERRARKKEKKRVLAAAAAAAAATAGASGSFAASSPPAVHSVSSPRDGSTGGGINQDAINEKSLSNSAGDVHAQALALLGGSVPASPFVDTHGGTMTGSSAGLGLPSSAANSLGHNPLLGGGGSSSVTRYHGNNSRRRREKGRAEAADCVGVIRSQVDLMRTIIDDCLDMSKIEAGVIQFESIGIELAVLARQCVQSLSNKCKEKGVRLRLRIDQTNLPRKVFADPTRLKQLIMNLLTNAIKFTSRGAVQLVLAATPWSVEAARAAELEILPEEEEAEAIAAAAGATPDTNGSAPHASQTGAAAGGSMVKSAVVHLAPPEGSSQRAGMPVPTGLEQVRISLANGNNSSSHGIGVAGGGGKDSHDEDVPVIMIHNPAGNGPNGSGTTPSAPPTVVESPQAESSVTKRPNRIILTVSVADSGSGIDPAALPHLFQPYSQEKLSIMRTHGGTGLGLAIVKNIVSHMRGSIQVQSEVGKGSKFTLFLPLECRAPGTAESNQGDEVDVQSTLLRLRALRDSQRDDEEEEDMIESHLLDKFDRNEEGAVLHTSSDSDSSGAPARQYSGTPKVRPSQPPTLMQQWPPLAGVGGAYAPIVVGASRNKFASNGGPNATGTLAAPVALRESSRSASSESGRGGFGVTFHEDRSDGHSSTSSRSGKKTPFERISPQKDSQIQQATAAVALAAMATSGNGGTPPKVSPPSAMSLQRKRELQQQQAAAAAAAAALQVEPLSIRTERDVNLGLGYSPPVKQDARLMVTPLSVPSTTRSLVSGAASTTLGGHATPSASESFVSSVGSHSHPNSAPQTGQMASRRLSSSGSSSGTGEKRKEVPTLHLLLVDDADVNLKILVKMLGNSLVHNGTKYALSLTLASNGVEAMAKIEHRFNNYQTIGGPRQFHIVASDIVMPLMDGFVLARTLRQFEQQHGLREVPLVALTANALKADVDAYTQASFRWFIAKPFRRADLQSALQLILNAAGDATLTSPAVDSTATTVAASPVHALATPSLAGSTNLLSSPPSHLA